MGSVSEPDRRGERPPPRAAWAPSARLQRTRRCPRAAIVGRPRWPTGVPAGLGSGREGVAAPCTITPQGTLCRVLDHERARSSAPGFATRPAPEIAGAARSPSPHPAPRNSGTSVSSGIEEFRIDRLPSGVPGFDRIALGGLPRYRSTLLVGPAGSGKTLFALEYLIAGVEQFDQNGVIMTFEETPADLIRNVE